MRYRRKWKMNGVRARLQPCRPRPTALTPASAAEGYNPQGLKAFGTMVSVRSGTAEAVPFRKGAMFHLFAKHGTSMRSIFLSLVVLIFAAANSRAVTADRVVASIGNVAITQSEVEQEVRFAQFLDGRQQSSEPGKEQLLAARNRLIEQNLLKEEAEADVADASGLNEQAARLLNEVRKLYPDEADYRAALESTGYTEAQAHQRLVANVRIVRLINRRLRPVAWVNHREIEEYYREQFVPEHRRTEKTPPPELEEVESVIREILTQQRVDQLLDQWIEEIETTRRVKIHPLQSG